MVRWYRQDSLFNYMSQLSYQGRAWEESFLQFDRLWTPFLAKAPRILQMEMMKNIDYERKMMKSSDCVDWIVLQVPCKDTNSNLLKCKWKMMILIVN